MKIGIITSGNENLTLFKFLNGYNHEYYIYYDQINRPYGDKDFLFSRKKILDAIKFLKNKGVEKIIIGPSCELYLLQNNICADILLPLFTNYLTNVVFPSSLVGKIGLFGDYADMQVAQGLINNLSQNYQLNDNQKNIKKFNFPFSFWCKETTMWKYYMITLSYSSFLVNKSIKFDLRYFKDCAVDTLIPLNYAYFNLQRTILKYFNFKKQRFHRLDNLKNVFHSFGLSQDDNYSVIIYCNGHSDFLLRDKRLLWLLKKGKQIDLNIEKI